jgi:hypothetical protein
MSAVTVTLGGVAFQDMEVPDQIPVGGEQLAVVHKLIGGARVIDTMGRDDVALNWSGRFLGSDALDRAQAIDAMRIAGAAVTLTWSTFAYTVVIKRFVYPYRADFWLGDYEIACEIVSDDAAPTSADDSDGPSLDDQMSDDAVTATSLAASIGGAVGALQSAVSAVMHAAPGLSGVASSLEGALGAVAGLTQSAGTLTIPGLIASLPTGGGAAVQSLTGLVSTLTSAVSKVAGATSASGASIASTTAFVSGAGGGVTSSPAFIV